MHFGGLNTFTLGSLGWQKRKKKKKEKEAANDNLIEKLKDIVASILAHGANRKAHSLTVTFLLCIYIYIISTDNTHLCVR